ncbi:sigma-70 family RNA polymerase sigma factor [Streptomyces sp. TRM 70351]|nr:sigma-70 family RNA polymerase sigma factor [Streptomyces sp. TRM 70351]MEE1929769.1 sigma-70 family RNA polymerase sigma factor [Streptomyces sp. TRM 70351]
MPDQGGPAARRAVPGARETVPEQRSGGAGPSGGREERRAGGGAGEQTGGDEGGGERVSDTELVSRMRSGDAGAYDEIFRRHAPAVRRYARSCCRDADTADDLTNEVFVRTLQAVQSGKGPQTAVRAYLLTSVRHAAAAWARTARREQLVDDFAAFAVAAAGGREAAAEETLDFGAEVRAIHDAEHSMVVRAFRTLPERWQTVLWHTAVEEASPREVAPLLGLTANATAVLAHRAREGLKQAYLQAHVSRSLTDADGCARYADRLGAFARGGLRARAERGLRKHLEQCARCRTAAWELRDVNARLRALLPTAVIGWAAGSYAAKGVAGAAGAAAGAAAGGSVIPGGSGPGGAAAEGLGASVKAGVTVSAVTAAAAALALALALSGSLQEEAPAPPQARPSAAPGGPAPSEPPVAGPARPQPSAGSDVPAPEPGPGREPAPSAPPASVPQPASKPPSGSVPQPGSVPSATTPPVPGPAPVSPTAGPEPAPDVPEPPVPPAPPPAPGGYRVAALPWDVRGAGDGPVVQLAGSSPVWQRSGLRIGGRTYAHGITVQAPSSVRIELNRECVAYEALAGVDDLTLGLGAVRFAVFGDGRQLWRSGVVRGGEPPVPVAVPLTGVRTLRLVVEPHTAFGAVAQADWAESVVRCR